MIEYAAPGKLFVTGEYAVLDGAPGLLVAVGVHAIARARQGDWAWISDNGLTYPFDVAQGEGLRWTGARPPDGVLLESIMVELAPEAAWPAPGFTLSVDTAEFRIHGTKLGLGSSASACAVLAAALLEAVNGAPADPFAAAKLSKGAHRRFQGDKGSGADVAAVIDGGFVQYSRSDKSGRASSLTWPEGLCLLPVWTGVSAQTSVRIGRYEQAREQFPKICEQLLEAAAAARDRFVDGDAGSCLQAFRDYSNQLTALDQAMNLGIWSAAHREIASTLTPLDAVYKPSGAGGGDCGLILAEAEKEDRLRRVLEGAGFDLPAWQLRVPGLRRVAQAT